MTARRRIAAFVALTLAVALPAQETLELQGPTPATVKLGDSAQVLIRVEGRGADPREPVLPNVPELAMDLSAPVRSSYSYYDGRTMIERQGVQYRLRLTPQREGKFVVPAFAIWTGTKSQRTRPIELTAVKDLRGENLGWVDVRIEPQRVYVHEPIRIEAAFGLDPGVRLVQDVYRNVRYLDVEVQAAWLTDFPGGERIETEAPSGDRRAIISNRELFHASFDPGFRRDGRNWHRYSFERAFLPTRTGVIELPAPTLRFQVVRRAGRRDILGRSRGAQTEQMYVYGQPVRIEVLPIPEAGRPTPYYGAVGRFSITAELDRNQVKVGSSVKLQITVRGAGNLEFLRMPEVEELPGFHKLGQAEAQRDADKVVVTYDLTPTSADVTAVPPIAWNYFDTTPGVEAFVEVATPELALDVQPLPEGETLTALPEDVAAPVTPGVDDIFDLPDLSGPPALADARAPWLGWLAALGPWLAVLLGLGFASALRRRRADVTGQRERAALRNCRQALQSGADPGDALAGYLGDRLDVPAAAVVRPSLRDDLMRTGLDSALAEEVSVAIERSTAARYGGGGGLQQSEVEALVARLENATIERSQWAGLMPIVFVLATGFAPGGVLVAQESVVQGAGSLAPASPPSPGTAGATAGASAAVAAYRAGDYQRADELFAAAYERTGDRRLLRARGNALYRLQDLPRALWAYKAARLGAPRDPELLRNIALVEQQLEVQEAAGGFAAELDRLRARLSPGERIALLAGFMFGAALCLVLGRRRMGWRWVGALLLLPGAWLAAEVLWFDAVRAPRAVALQELAITSEPRADLEAVATARPGVTVEVLGGTSGRFVRVAAGERSGYVPRELIAVID